jgi:molecular chaperone GrpE
MALGKKRDEVKKEVEQELKEKAEEKDVKDAAEAGEAAKTETNGDTASSEETKDTGKAEITEEIKKRDEEIEALNNRLLRLQADHLNFKTRTEKEKISTYGDAVSGVICDLLPVIDNLERAITADNSENGNFKEGVEMVYNQLMVILNKKGLKEIDALHKPFDHNLHYGVAFEECEEYDDGIIIDVLQKGYVVNDKLIRPSMVRICRK